MRPKKAAFLTKAHGKPIATPGVICHPKGRSKAEDGAAVDRSRSRPPRSKPFRHAKLFFVAVLGEGRRAGLDLDAEALAPVIVLAC